MALGQNIAPMTINKCVKFHYDSLSHKKVMAQVKVCHANNNYYNYNYDHDTRVKTIPRVFFSSKTVELKMCPSSGQMKGVNFREVS